MHLILSPIAKCSVRDEIVTTLVLHEPLWRNFVELPRLFEMVALDVLCMKVMLDYVAVPVSILSLSLHIFHVAHHCRIMHLVGDGIVVGCVPSSVAWRNLILCSEMYFDIACVICMFRIFLILGIVELLRDWIEAIRSRVLLYSLELVGKKFSFGPLLVVERISIVHDVEIPDPACLYLSLPSRSLHASGTLVTPVPVMLVVGQT